MTYAELKAQLDALTPEQLAMPVVWSGDERGGHIKTVWIADEDWIYGPDMAASEPRSEAMKTDPDHEDASVVIPKGTVHLMVD